MHGLERSTHAEHEEHEAPLGEARVVDQIRIDGVLQVASPVVGQQDVDRLASLAPGVTDARDLDASIVLDGVIHRADDVGVRGEECVRFHFFQGL